jgi:hypothetical protein
VSETAQATRHHWRILNTTTGATTTVRATTARNAAMRANGAATGVTDWRSLGAARVGRGYQSGDCYCDGVPRRKDGTPVGEGE